MGGAASQRLLCEQLRVQPVFALTRFIAYGYTLAGVRERALTVGFDACLFKPVDPVELLQHLASSKVGLGSMVGAGKMISRRSERETVVATATHDVILVVDDYADGRNSMVDLLDAYGYPAATAANGREALTFLHHHAVCLILLDLTMPVMDGWELARELSQDPRLATIPVVIISASICAGNRKPPPAAACLGKPLDVDDLLATVAQYC